MPKQVEPEEKERKRRARVALMKLRGRLRQGCTTLSSVRSWYDAIAPLVEWQRDYGGYLSPDQTMRLRDAMRITDAGRATIAKACRLLDAELGDVMRSLPAPAGAAVGAWVAGILVVGAIAVGGAVLYRNLARVEIVVRNVGCADIPIQQEYSAEVNRILDLLGLDPPHYIPQNNEVALGIGVLPMNVVVAQRGNAVVANVGGLDATLLQVSGNLRAEFDGVPLGSQTLSLGRAGHHELVLTCR